VPFGEHQKDIRKLGLRKLTIAIEWIVERALSAAGTSSKENHAATFLWKHSEKFSLDSRLDQLQPVTATSLVRSHAAQRPKEKVKIQI